MTPSGLDHQNQLQLALRRAQPSLNTSSDLVGQVGIEPTTEGL
jgi:hypothetical protein